uniref:Polymerase nucleotidyl transferase domain-containing protein n=1 Tax=Geobacter metallireducens TaxID=28232 RepID=A0A831UDY1_GEOME
MGRDDRIRRTIAQEAARLMYEEGVREYRDAKRKAARRFGPVKALSLGSHLPSNAEIHAELQRLLQLHEEKVLPERLLGLRLRALRIMELLERFRPHLVGSVLSGAVREGSDIDLHLFADSHGDVEEFLREEGIPYELEIVTIRRGGEFIEYPHIYLEEDGVLVECTVYPPGDIHRIPRSSITGKPMERADARKLRKLIAGEGDREERS